MNLTRKQAAAVLLGAQLVLVLSIGAKYLYERKTRPRVWARAAQFDPEQPLRGRYLALQLIMNACALPKESFRAYGPGFGGEWTVAVEARNGRLVAVANPTVPQNAEHLVTWREDGCERARLRESLEYFIPDTARGPFPLKPGQELWVEVTVPAEGPPRPIQLALSDAGGFRVLNFD